jgi:hypothetical protein
MTIPLPKKPPNTLLALGPSQWLTIIFPMSFINCFILKVASDAHPAAAGFFWPPMGIEA